MSEIPHKKSIRDGRLGNKKRINDRRFDNFARRVEVSNGKDVPPHDWHSGLTWAGPMVSRRVVNLPQELKPQADDQPARVPGITGGVDCVAPAKERARQVTAHRFPGDDHDLMIGERRPRPLQTDRSSASRRSR
jgi:hypothetical protein